MTYSIATRNADQITFTNHSAADVIGMLDEAQPLHRAHANAVRELVRDGCRYCNHDLDVLSSALTVALTGRTEVRSFEAKWVERMQELAA